MEATFVRATWPEKPGFSGRHRNLAAVASDGLAIHERPTYASGGGNFTVGLPALPWWSKEAPHSALTGADAARADVTGRLLEPFRGACAFSLRLERIRQQRLRSL